MPPHAKSAIANAQCHNIQHANSTTTQSNDHTEHSVTNTLPTYASNTVHHTPTKTALSPGESTTLLISYYHLPVVPLVTIILSMLQEAIISFTPIFPHTVNMAHVTYQFLQLCMIPLDHLLMEEPMAV